LAAKIVLIYSKTPKIAKILYNVNKGSCESTTFERATKESRNMSAATKERSDKRAPRQKSAATK
jgi:hypothetical protein